MRRADRLFEIIQILRRSRRPVTADAIAEELETSKRTIYRDIAALLGRRVPIRGEAGVGYVLEDGFDLPPLMLTVDEVEAAVLGAQWVSRRGDPTLAKAAENLLAKIASTVPEDLRAYVLDPVSAMPPRWGDTPEPIDLAQLRAQIRAGRKLMFSYRDQAGADTRRTVWPCAVGYMEMSRMLVAWCELREAFRHFRLDRISDPQWLEDRYPQRPAVLRGTWRKEMMEKMKREAHYKVAAPR
ncbi:MAG TPA: YafY family protein [Caulobacteraceae bacterium]|jgi:predicted DNA-binding transcriptional regulator YafY|nr:YafY family protein [Caulobacteraceae bacterium]